MALTKIERIKRRETRLLLYALERKWGVPADLYKEQIGEPNFLTGEPSLTRTKHHIPKLITHELRLDNKFEYDLSFLAANKNFTYGGIYNPGDRIAIVNGMYVPSIDMKDYIVYDGKKYVLQRMERLDYGLGYILHLRHTPGTKPNQTHERAVWSRVTPSQELEGEI